MVGVPGGVRRWRRAGRKSGREPDGNLGTWSRAAAAVAERESDERKEGRATARAHGRSFTVGFLRRVTRHGVRFANVEPDPGIYPLVCWCYPAQSNQGTSEPTSTDEVETKSVHSKKNNSSPFKGPPVTSNMGLQKVWHRLN